MTIPFLAIGPGTAAVSFLSVGPSVAGVGDSIVVDAPLAGDRVLVGETIEIHVSVTPGVSGLFDVLLSLDGGSTFAIILQTDEAEINLGWTITAAHISATAVVRVRDAADALIFGDSGEFVIGTTTPGVGDNTDVLAAIAALQADVDTLTTIVNSLKFSGII